ncbi:MAG: hypothetical protein IPN06_19045 [Burkholderiales bacterium]|nr:hypothetical protein [Burkholderiales bacterium]
MLFSWLDRVIHRGSATADSAASVFAVHLPDGVATLAKYLREQLRAQAKLPGFLDKGIPKIAAQLASQGWPSVELEKVRAYADFFEGADARAYQRVVENGLARGDYAMFITAAESCYLADRFVDGAALLDMFDPHEDETTDWCEYARVAGYLHIAAGRPFEQGLTYFDVALERALFSPGLAVNAGNLYFEAGRMVECNALREGIVRHCPDDPEALFALSYVELARGYYPEGFRLMEARYRMPEVGLYMNLSVMNKERWQGQSISGKRLLVHGEQGLGDMLMMVRYLPLLHAQGVALVVDSRSEVLSLMAHNFPYCTWITSNHKEPIHESFDQWVGIMSLPYCFQTTVFNAPAADGYITVPTDQKQYWKDRVHALARGARLRVGLAWSGNPGHRSDKRRSVPFDVVLPLLTKHEDVCFFSLQTHVPDGSPPNLADMAEELVTVADTAAVIGEMDLVISVDTSAIHLAGAMGCPAWLLLPHRYEWRWGLDGPKCAWYQSVRIWRQERNGAWEALLEKVHVALQQFAAKGEC